MRFPIGRVVRQQQQLSCEVAVAVGSLCTDVDRMVMAVKGSLIERVFLPWLITPPPNEWAGLG